MLLKYMYILIHLRFEKLCWQKIKMKEKSISQDLYFLHILAARNIMSSESICSKFCYLCQIRLLNIRLIMAFPIVK